MLLQVRDTVRVLHQSRGHIRYSENTVVTQFSLDLVRMDGAQQVPARIRKVLRMFE